MYEFTYRKAASLDEAKNLFAAGEDATYMSGSRVMPPDM